MTRRRTAVTVTIGVDALARLDAFARLRGMNRSEAVRALVDQFAARAVAGVHHASDDDEC